MPNLLLIDDDERLAELLTRFFSSYEMSLTAAVRPSEGLALLENSKFDLVILDIMLPEMDGFEVCKVIRKESAIPIIMLTACGEVMDRIIGLELGADDYLPKPFEPRELVARINTILNRRHHSPQSSQIRQYGTLKVDLDLREACLADKLLQLSSSEYQLLALFVQHPGKNFSRDEILNHLKGTDIDFYTRAVDILVSRLRQKLKPETFIKTIRGLGYCFVGRAS